MESSTAGAARAYRPGQFKNSQKSRELRKKVQAITRACSKDIPALINTGLAKMYLRIDDFVKTSPCLKKTFPQQILWRQETRLLFRPARDAGAAGAGGVAAPTAAGASLSSKTAPASPLVPAASGSASAPAATPVPPVIPASTAITREALLSFNGADPECVVVAAEPVREVRDLYMQIEEMADEFIAALEELQVYVTSLLPQETQSGADSGNVGGLYEILEDVMRALTATAKIYEAFTTYHTERAQLVKLVRKHGVWDFYQALLLHDSRCLSDLRVFANDMCNNVCAMYDMLRKSEDVLKKPSASAVHKIMF